MKSEWKKCTLFDYCNYANDKVSCSLLSENNYVSTENLLPNRGGVEKAISIPSTESTRAFTKNDILVSNIRPYFKKIYYAKCDGGCSADVLVFRAKEYVDSKFLYYLLSDDNFFMYATKTSKGTKMPRGDKNAIMQYEVYDIDLPTQKKIAAILSALDAKIENNNAINKNLEAQAQALFKSWFVDFEPFGGVMPEGWKEGKAEEIIEIHDGKRIPLSNMQRAKLKKIYPYYGATCIMDYVDDYLFDGVFLLFAEDGTVITKDGNPVLQYVDGKFWVNNHAHILTGKNCFSTEMLWLVFCKMSINSIVTGAVQPKISQGNLRQLDVVIPTQDILYKFDSLIQPLFKKIRMTKQESARLVALRDTLLPKLMSGEIEV